MKKALAYFFSILIVSLLCSLFFVSCSAKQPLKEWKETATVNRDSINNTQLITRNLAIIDSLKIVIGKVKTTKPECDSVCQIAIDRLLSQLNNKKTSGSNSVETKYDDKDNSININTKVGETKSDTQRTYYKITRTKTIYSHRDIPVDKPLAKWQLFLMIIGSLTIGYLFLKTTLFIKSKIPV